MLQKVGAGFVNEGVGVLVFHDLPLMVTTKEESARKQRPDEGCPAVDVLEKPQPALVA
jgi:hypothetical protein